MHRMNALILAGFLSGSVLPGDAVDDGLGAQAPEQLRLHTRTMIQAGMPTEDAVRMTRAMEEHQFRTTEILHAQEIVMNALRAGLPPGPLLDKAREGLAKGAQAQAVTRAMERTRARYEHAYERASSLATPGPGTRATGDAIAGALAAGLAEPDADRIHEQLRTEARDRVHQTARACYLTARVMAGYRVASATVADTICSALQAGYRAQDMERLRSLFMRRARLENPGQVALQYMKRIQGGASPANLDEGARQGNMGGSSQSGSSSGSSSGGKGTGGSNSGGKGPGGNGLNGK